MKSAIVLPLMFCCMRTENPNEIRHKMGDGFALCLETLIAMHTFFVCPSLHCSLLFSSVVAEGDPSHSCLQKANFKARLCQIWLQTSNLLQRNELRWWTPRPSVFNGTVDDWGPNLRASLLVSILNPVESQEMSRLDSQQFSCMTCYMS